MKIKELLDILGLDLSYSNLISNSEVVKAALVHPSRGGDPFLFQRLEFFGDKILSFFLVQRIFDCQTGYSESEMSIKLAQCASATGIFEVATHSGLDKVFTTAQSKKCIVDSMEALIAALFIACGYNIVESVILKLWSDLILEKPIKDSKSLLQEICYRNFGAIPKYELVEENRGIFTIKVSFLEYESLGMGTNKQMAEIDAATKILTLISNI